MKFEAIIFDLFGTLIDNFSKLEHRNILSNMASILSAPREAFIQGWFDTFDLRSIGKLSSVEENIYFVCERLNLLPNQADIKTAAKIRYDFTQKSLIPKDGAIPILQEIREYGFKLGLITDCSSEVPKIWGDTPFSPLFDVCIFSCIVGIKKPNIEVYNLACKRLLAFPEYCLFIGDGSNNELSGARLAGMYPLMIQDPNESDAHRIDEEQWDGPKICRFEEILSFIR